uniref:Enoyl-CoA hydratase n=1 Tax=Octactis speculum TaxID=3111310 RepID=A0A7S2GRD6_9STRA
MTGEGRAFSAGGDLDFLRDRCRDKPERNAAVMRSFYRRFLSIRNSLTVPTISALNGPAIGAGLCVALATDIRVAHPDCKLGLTFVKLGLHPGMGGTHFLPQLVGPMHAARLLLTGDVITGEEAHRMGLVLLAEDPVGHALELANRIALQDPGAVRMCTRSLRMSQDEGLERALWREADCQAHNYATSVEEGLAALVEKRPPNWQQS